MSTAKTLLGNTIKGKSIQAGSHKPLSAKVDLNSAPPFNKTRDAKGVLEGRGLAPNSFNPKETMHATNMGTPSSKVGSSIPGPQAQLNRKRYNLSSGDAAKQPQMYKSAAEMIKQAGKMSETGEVVKDVYSEAEEGIKKEAILGGLAWKAKKLMLKGRKTKDSVVKAIGNNPTKAAVGGAGLLAAGTGIGAALNSGSGSPKNPNQIQNTTGQM